MIERLIVKPDRVLRGGCLTPSRVDDPAPEARRIRRAPLRQEFRFKTWLGRLPKRSLAARCETNSVGKTNGKAFFMAEREQSHTPGPNKLPARYLQLQKKYPKVL